MKSVLSRKLVFLTCNCRHVIKYDIYVKFSQIFAHCVQIYAKISCENLTDFCTIFFITKPLCLGGAFFHGHDVYPIGRRTKWRFLVEVHARDSGKDFVHD